MKLTTLSGHPNKGCTLLRFKDVHIILDCGLDLTSTSLFVPLTPVQNLKLANLGKYSPRDIHGLSHKDLQQLESELRECNGRVLVDSAPEFCSPDSSIMSLEYVDIILITNHYNMLALPYITERSSFKGVVYATEPTIQIAKSMMDEMIKWIERTPKVKRASKWKTPEIFPFLPFMADTSFMRPWNWNQIYSSKEVTSCLLKVKTVGFGEKIDIFGTLEIQPLSSGFCIGSCNWVIKSAHEKIVYISGSSTLTTHPKPIETSPMKNADLLILSGLTQAPLANPDSMLGELCINIASTLKGGGNVLIPCFPSGVILDLIECLALHLEQNSLNTIPMYFISPVADFCLQYANITAEWLTQSKQSKVYVPEEPFVHSYLVRNNRLKHYAGVHLESFNNDYRTPCVVFAGHPSLRFGDAVHFIQMWSSSPQNLLVFVEPEFPHVEALSPFQPMAMRSIYCPIDTSLNFNQANKLLRDLKPAAIAVPEQYLILPPQYRHRSDLINELIIKPECPVFPLKRNIVVKIPIQQQFERIEIESDVADGLTPVEVKPGVSMATLTGALLSKDNKLRLEPLNKEVVQKANEALGAGAGQTPQVFPPQLYTWGSLDVEHLMEMLTNAGIYNPEREQTPGGCIVHLRSEHALIHIEEGSTNIICDGDSKLRTFLRDIVLQCLKKF